MLKRGESYSAPSRAANPVRALVGGATSGICDGVGCQRNCGSLQFLIIKGFYSDVQTRRRTVCACFGGTNASSFELRAWHLSRAHRARARWGLGSFQEWAEERACARRSSRLLGRDAVLVHQPLGGDDADVVGLVAVAAAVTVGATVRRAPIPILGED